MDEQRRTGNSSEAPTTTSTLPLIEGELMEPGELGTSAREKEHGLSRLSREAAASEAQLNNTDGNALLPNAPGWQGWNGSAPGWPVPAQSPTPYSGAAGQGGWSYGAPPGAPPGALPAPSSPQGMLSAGAPQQAGFVHGGASGYPQSTPYGQGLQLPAGMQAPHGLQAPQGMQGPHGMQAPQGMQGPHGMQAPQGMQGPHGMQAPQGMQGPHGMQAPQGMQGPHGMQAPQGMQGPHGMQAPQGTPHPYAYGGGAGQASTYPYPGGHPSMAQGYPMPGSTPQGYPPGYQSHGNVPQGMMPPQSMGNPPPPMGMMGSAHPGNMGVTSMPGQGMQGQGMQGQGLYGQGMQGHGMQGQGMQGQGLYGQGMQGQHPAMQDMHGKALQGQGLHGQPPQGQAIHGQYPAMQDMHGQGMQGQGMQGQGMQGQGMQAPYPYGMMPINVVVQNHNSAPQVVHQPAQGPQVQAAPPIGHTLPALLNYSTLQYSNNHDVLVRTHTRSKGMAVLLAFFLGWLGAQRFYLGQTGWGIFSLIFFWTPIPALIGIWQGIKLFLMSQEDFDRLHNYERQLGPGQS